MRKLIVFLMVLLFIAPVFSITHSGDPPESSYELVYEDNHETVISETEMLTVLTINSYEGNCIVGPGDINAFIVSILTGNNAIMLGLVNSFCVENDNIYKQNHIEYQCSHYNYKDYNNRYEGNLVAGPGDSFKTLA